jgi:hypothetical protein
MLLAGHQPLHVPPHSSRDEAAEALRLSCGRHAAPPTCLDPVDRFGSAAIRHRIREPGSRRVTSSMRAWAAAMLARCIGTRPDRVARASVVSRTARRSARATAWRSATEVSRAACTASALPTGGGHPYRECPVESCGPQPGRQACADGWPGLTAASPCPPRRRSKRHRRECGCHSLYLVPSRCWMV